MTDQAWETLSNQAIAAAGIVYFLSLLAYLVQWASLRNVPVGRTASRKVAVGAGGLEDETTDEPVEATSRRADMTGRLGLILAGLACSLHLVSLVGRGMAADPNRVPWGNMYEFTVSGTFVVALIFLVARRRLGLDWAGPLVVAIVLTLLMVSVIWLYDPVAPLTEALNSYWLVIHVVSAVIATGTFTLGGLCSVLYLSRTARSTSPPATSRASRSRRRSTRRRTACTRSPSPCGPSPC